LKVQEKFNFISFSNCHEQAQPSLKQEHPSVAVCWELDNDTRFAQRGGNGCLLTGGILNPRLSFFQRDGSSCGHT